MYEKLKGGNYCSEPRPRSGDGDDFSFGKVSLVSWGENIHRISSFGLMILRTVSAVNNLFLGIGIGAKGGVVPKGATKDRLFGVQKHALYSCSTKAPFRMLENFGLGAFKLQPWFWMRFDSCGFLNNKIFK